MRRRRWRSPSLEPEPLNVLTQLAVVPLVLAQVLVLRSGIRKPGSAAGNRCTKPAQAVAWAVGIYFAVALFVPTLAEMMFFRTNRPMASGLALGQPDRGADRGHHDPLPWSLLWASGICCFHPRRSGCWSPRGLALRCSYRCDDSTQFDRRMGRISRLPVVDPDLQLTRRRSARGIRATGSRPPISSPNDLACSASAPRHAAHARRPIASPGRPGPGSTSAKWYPGRRLKIERPIGHIEHPSPRP